MPVTLRSFDSSPTPLAAATMLLMSLVSVDALAQDCLHWGDLDKKLYCDESRDLVADTPSRGYQLQNPDTLVFSHGPMDDPSVYEAAFGEFMRYLSKTTGKKVRWHGTKSSADQIKAMRAGEVQIAGISPGPTVYAVNLAGYVPIAVMCKSDGTFGYPLNLITGKNSNIASRGDLGGRKVAHVSPLSNSGQAAEGVEIVYPGSQGKLHQGSRRRRVRRRRGQFQCPCAHGEPGRRRPGEITRRLEIRILSVHLLRLCPQSGPGSAKEDPRCISDIRLEKHGTRQGVRPASRQILHHLLSGNLGIHPPDSEGERCAV